MNNQAIEDLSFATFVFASFHTLIGNPHPGQQRDGDDAQVGRPLLVLVAAAGEQRQLQVAWDVDPLRQDQPRELGHREVRVPLVQLRQHPLQLRDVQG